MGISLWLVPAAAQMDVIKSCLPRCPSIDPPPLSPSSFPAFLPHITLATISSSSDPDIQDVLLGAVPEHQQPIRADFQSIVVSDHYFRSVLIDVLPTRELVDLQSHIAIYLRRRGLEPSSPIFPHMSLCYIADEDESHRERMVRALRDAGVVCQTPQSDAVTSVYLASMVKRSGWSNAKVLSRAGKW